MASNFSNSPVRSQVKEMLKARDSNASRMLRLITEQFLSNPRLMGWRNQGRLFSSVTLSQARPTLSDSNCSRSLSLGNSSDKFRQLWDQLVALWVYIALNPHATANERKKISDYLYSWTTYPNVPLEDANSRLTGSQLRRKLDSSDDEEDANRSGDELMLDEHVAKMVDDNNNYAGNYNDRKRPAQSLIKIGKRKKKRYAAQRTIFHRALEASHENWDHPHLRFIIDEEKAGEKNGAYARAYPPVKLESAGQFGNHCSSANCAPNLKFNSKNQPLWNGA